MLKEQVDELRKLNADLATAVETEKAEIKALVDTLRGSVDELQTVVTDLQAKLAELDSIDLISELDAVKAIAEDVKGISEAL
jgi:flagellar hook-length control protein FliK